MSIGLLSYGQVPSGKDQTLFDWDQHGWMLWVNKETGRSHEQRGFDDLGRGEVQQTKTFVVPVGSYPLDKRPVFVWSAGLNS